MVTAKKPRKPRVVIADRPMLRFNVSEDYRQGMSIREIAAIWGLSYSTVHNLLVEAGTTFRVRGGANRAGADDV